MRILVGPGLGVTLIDGDAKAQWEALAKFGWSGYGALHSIISVEIQVVAGFRDLPERADGEWIFHEIS